jgi:hypothetical protein
MHKGFRYFNPFIGRLYISHDVFFDENQFPFVANGSAIGAQYTSDVLLLSNAVSRNNSSTNVDQSPTCLPLPVFCSCVQQQQHVHGAPSLWLDFA